MAHAQGDATESSSIDAILKSLSNRPNVQSTLILSRKDGSIIRSSGFKTPQSASNTSQQGYKDNANETASTSDKIEGGGNNDTDSHQEQEPSPAERLAASIYTFVKAADGLALVVSTNETAADTLSSGRASETTKGRSEQTESNTAEIDHGTDVHLLRMRTMRQEVIIFPDSNYLCCVVQNVSRAMNAETNR